MTTKQSADALSVETDPGDPLVAGGSGETDEQFTEDKTYLVIDGVDEKEFTDEEAEHLERMVLEYTLGKLGLQVTDVRIAGRKYE